MLAGRYQILGGVSLTIDKASLDLLVSPLPCSHHQIQVLGKSKADCRRRSATGLARLRSNVRKGVVSRSSVLAEVRVAREQAALYTHDYHAGYSSIDLQ